MTQSSLQLYLMHAHGCNKAKRSHSIIQTIYRVQMSRMKRLWHSHESSPRNKTKPCLLIRLKCTFLVTTFVGRLSQHSPFVVVPSSDGQTTYQGTRSENKAKRPMRCCVLPDTHIAMHHAEDSLNITIQLIPLPASIRPLILFLDVGQTMSRRSLRLVVGTSPVVA